MAEVSIVKAHPDSPAGSQLNRMALDSVAYILAGSRDEKIIQSTLEKLWKNSYNRFSHQYAYEAKMGGVTLGVVTCYPIGLLKQLAWPTVKKLWAHRNLELIKYSLLHPGSFFSTLTLKEGHEGEYHIGTLATLPESRGLGIGTQLLHFAEQQALLQGYAKSSLTVRQDNPRAAKLYERVGYVVMGQIDRPGFSLYRMTKELV